MKQHPESSIMISDLLCQDSLQSNNESDKEMTQRLGDTSMSLLEIAPPRHNNKVQRRNNIAVHQSHAPPLEMDTSDHSFHDISFSDSSSHSASDFAASAVASFSSSFVEPGILRRRRPTKVRFSEVEVQRHAVILGGHSQVKHYPMSLDWSHEPVQCYSLEEYESSKTTGRARMSRLSRKERRLTLSRAMDISLAELSCREEERLQALEQEEERIELLEAQVGDDDDCDSDEDESDSSDSDDESDDEWESCDDDGSFCDEDVKEWEGSVETAGSSMMPSFYHFNDPDAYFAALRHEQPFLPMGM